jgi:hypothetical protein
MKWIWWTKLGLAAVLLLSTTAAVIRPMAIEAANMAEEDANKLAAVAEAEKPVIATATSDKLTAVPAAVADQQALATLPMDTPVEIAGEIAREETQELASVLVSSNSRIGLGDGQILEVSNARRFKHDGLSICSFEVALQNHSSTDMLLDDYYLVVKTHSGSVMDFKLLPEDVDQRIVPAGAVGKYRFYGAVANGIDASGLILEAGRWDFNSDSLHVLLGSVALSDAQAHNEGQEVEVSAKNTKLQGSISAVAWRSLGKNKEATWTATFRNSGTLPAMLPEWGFWLQTADGHLYSMLPDRGPEGHTIGPGADISFILTTTLPAESDLSHAGLVLTRILTEASKAAKTHVPTAFLPMPAEAISTETGGIRTVAATKGKFTAALESLQRWAWDDRDLITAAITLTNISDTAEPVPLLSGTFRAADTEEWTAQMVRTDSIRLLQPGQSTRLFLQANLDQDETVQSWDILLQEQIISDSGGKTQAVHLTEWSKLPAVSAKEISAGQETDMSGIGGAWTYTATAPVSYESTTGQLITVRVDAMNRDKRYNPVAKWVAQFLATDGTVYPAEVEATAQRVIPQGKASLTAWTVVPKGVDPKGLNLMLGLAVTGGKLSGPSDKPDSFLQASVFQLPEGGDRLTDGVNKFILYPYTLNINEFHRPNWYYNDKRATFELTFSFDYTLLKDLSIVSEMKKRRVVVELLDGLGNKIHEKSYTLEPEEAGAGAGGTAGTTGNTGTNGTNASISWTVGSETEKWLVDMKDISINTSKYTVNIYEEFLPGYRRLIGNTTSDWVTY